MYRPRKAATAGIVAYWRGRLRSSFSMSWSVVIFFCLLLDLTLLDEICRLTIVVRCKGDMTIFERNESIDDGDG